jgi:hypothetical protein
MGISVSLRDRKAVICPSSTTTIGAAIHSMGVTRRAAVMIVGMRRCQLNPVYTFYAIAATTKLRASFPHWRRQLRLVASKSLALLEIACFGFPLWNM